MRRRFEPWMEVKKGDHVAAHVLDGGRPTAFTSPVPFGGMLGLRTAPGPKDWSPRKGTPPAFHAIGELSAQGAVMVLRIIRGREVWEYGPFSGPGVLGVQKRGSTL